MSTTIYVQIPNGHGASANHVVKMDIAPQMTMDEVKNFFSSAADIPESDKDVILKLTKKDGTLVPITPHLAPNDINDPYILFVKSNKTQSLTIKQGLIDTKLTEIANALASMKDLGNLKEQINSLNKRLEDQEKQVNMNPLYIGGSSAPKAAIKRITKIDPRFQNQPKYVFTEETVQYLKQPSFNNWQWEENEMTALMENMFFELGLVDHFKIDLPTLKRFLITVKDNYNLNPFHNFRHCFCVTQMMYGLLHTCKLLDKLDHLDKLTLIVSAIGHDLDHPGFNNAYQINARTELAIIYNDQSPLENHHCAVTFTILKDAETNIVKNLTDKEYNEFRKGVIRCILSTDMAKHGDYMARFKAITETFNLSDPEHKALLEVMLMKCSDISNEARPSDVAEPWVDALLEEFFAQSDLEKAQGLPVAPFMDRDKVTKSGAQIGFIGFVMIPLFETVAKVLPEIDTAILPQIRKAHAHYKDLGAKQTAAPPAPTSNNPAPTVTAGK